MTAWLWIVPQVRVDDESGLSFLVCKEPQRVWMERFQAVCFYCGSPGVILEMPRTGGTSSGFDCILQVALSSSEFRQREKEACSCDGFCPIINCAVQFTKASHLVVIQIHPVIYSAVHMPFMSGRTKVIQGHLLTLERSTLCQSTSFGFSNFCKAEIRRHLALVILILF